MDYVVSVKSPEIVKIERNGKKELVNIPNVEKLDEKKVFSARFHSVKQKVLKILKEDEYARKNYLWLCLVFWAECEQIKIIIPKEKFSHVNSPETICRAYRHLHEEAKKGNPELRFLLKDGECEWLRNNREDEMRDYFSGEKYKKRVRIVK